MAKRWYIVQAYSNFERKVAEDIRQKVAQNKLERPVRGRDRPDRKGRRDAARPQGRRRTQVLPRLRAGEDGYDQRGVPSHQEHAQGHRFPRFGRQADADLREGGDGHPAAGAGRRRASQALRLVRGRRAGARLRRPLCQLQWRRRGSRRGARRASRSKFRFSGAPPRWSSNTVRSKRSDRDRHGPTGPENRGRGPQQPAAGKPRTTASTAASGGTGKSGPAGPRKDEQWQRKLPAT